jgi:signal transduction histidine kinase/Tfp pilus assembly protein PilF
MRSFFALLFVTVMVIVRSGLARDQHDIDSVITSLHHSLNKEIRNGDSLQVAKMCLDLGIHYIKQENYHKALVYLVRAKRLNAELGDDSALVIVYNKLALVNRYLGQYPDAISHYEAGIRLAEQIGDTAQAYQTRVNLGLMYKLQGNYEKALELALGVLPYYENSDNREFLVYLDHCIGGLFYDRKEYNEALKYFNASMEGSIGLGSMSDMADNLSAIGLVFREQGGLEQALEHQFQALELYAEIGSKKDIGRTFLEIGNTYALSGSLDQATDYYYKSLDIAREIQDNEIGSECMMGFGETIIRKAANSSASKKREMYDSARSYLREALDISTAIGQKEYILNIYRLLYEADSATGDLGSAISNYKFFTLYKDSLNDIETKKRIAHLDYKFLGQQKEKEIAVLAKDNEIKALQIRRQKMLRNGILFTAGLLIITGILIFRSIRLKRELEKQQAVSAERERISEDLHDDVGSGLSKIILMLEVLKNESVPPQIKEKASVISEESLELSKNMSGVIWALNSRYDSLESLVAFIRKYAGDYFENTTLKFKMNAPSNFPPVHLGSEERRNIYYAVKEALHNIVKHANATVAEINVTYADQVLSLSVSDNGRGMPYSELNRFGNGIIQMQKRMESVGGGFFLENIEGTRITFTLPVGKNRP